MVGLKNFLTAILFNVYGLIAKSVSENEHLEPISLYTRQNLLSKPHVHSNSPANLSDSSEVTSDKCEKASIYETKFNVIKVCTDMSQLISDHAPSQICQFQFF